LRFYAGQHHVDEGRRLRTQGQLDEALVEFQKAYGIKRPMASTLLRRWRRRRSSAPGA
jgi:hypothetical protein